MNIFTRGETPSAFELYRDFSTASLLLLNTAFAVKSFVEENYFTAAGAAFLTIPVLATYHIGRGYRRVHSIEETRRFDQIINFLGRMLNEGNLRRRASYLPTNYSTPAG